MTNTGQVKTFSILRYMWRIWLVFATGVFMVAAAHAATVPNQRLAFDHLTTGYPLVGQHEFVSCEACHVGGVFKGTPKQCTGCHNGVVASGKPANHIPTTAQCDLCHNVAVSFVKSAKMNHAGITGSCGTCHNGTLATGKNTGHISTALDCNTCHTTITFAGARFAHTPEQVGTKKCFDCHNGVNATGKKPTHIPSPNTCDTCHTTAGWNSASLKFIHSPEQIGTKRCSDCHNGTTATGKGPTHINSTNACEACHQPNTAWSVKKVDHTQVSGTCAACHNGTIARGKGPNHIPSTQECTYCHTVIAWEPTQFDHSPAQLGGRACSVCHDGTAARGKGATHINSTNLCSACHKPNSDWKVVLLGVDHTQTIGTCESCHNGTNAKTKSANHIASSNLCSTCHKSTTNWQVATNAVDHAQVQGTCVSCHISGNTKNVKTFKSTTHPNTTNNCTACHDVSPTPWATYKKPINHAEVIGSCANTGCHTAPTIGNTKSSTHPATTNRCEACHAIPPTLWTAYKKPIDHKEILGSCVSCHVSGGVSQGKGPTHPTTSNTCLACHAIPPAKWTPAIKVDHKEVTGSCVSCHVSGNTMNVKTFKSSTHPSTNDNCGACHAVAPAKWLPILKMDHTQTTATCISCHDGVRAKGKGTTHIATSNNCTACHTTTAWLPYRKVEHTEIPNAVSGLCKGCHNGTTAKGKSSTHIAYVPATLECIECHTTTAWAPTFFDHTKVNTSNCYGCHNGTNARGKGVTHIATTTLCSACHRPSAVPSWSAFVVDHAQVTGSCVSCHISGNTKNVKTFKSSTHPNTSNNCVACHDKAPGKWTPVLRVDHAEVIGSCGDVGCHSAPTIGQVKTATHMSTSNRCDLCHVTSPLLWKPVPSNKVAHTLGGVLGACSGCHTSGMAFGAYTMKTYKSVSHIPSTNLCDTCHDAPPGGAGWRAVIVDHAQITGVNVCTSCHSKSATHPNTTNNCTKCHSSGPPGKWKPALRVDHAEVLGSCSSCHNGINAKGKGTSHFITTAECTTCHTVSGWSPVNYTHTPGTRFVTHAFSTSLCSRCHTPAPGTSIAKKPYPYTICASCHYDDYLRGHSGAPGNKSDCRGSGCHNSMSKW